MNIEWAIDRLRGYLQICEMIEQHREQNGHEWDETCDRMDAEAQLRLSTVEKIVGLAYPTAPSPLMPPSYSSHDSEQYIRRALGALTDMEDVETHLRPTAPIARADQFHPDVWGSVATVWPTGEYRAALQQAAITFSARVRAKSGSKLHDRKLVAQVFSPDPPKGEPRLHFPGDPSDEDWRSRQQGLHLLAQGAFAGIRNVAAHSDDDWTEQEALELLAVFSILARWTDAAEVWGASD